MNNNSRKLIPPGDYRTRVISAGHDQNALLEITEGEFAGYRIVCRRDLLLKNAYKATIISELVDEQVVKGMPRVRQLLQDAHIGEHHQKIALDAPQRFSSLIELAEEYTEREISAKIRELDKIKKDIEKD